MCSLAVVPIVWPLEAQLKEGENFFLSTITIDLPLNLRSIFKGENTVKPQVDLSVERGEDLNCC